MSLQSQCHEFCIVRELFFRNVPAKGIVRVPTPRRQASTLGLSLRAYPEMGYNLFHNCLHKINNFSNISSKQVKKMHQNPRSTKQLSAQFKLHSFKSINSAKDKKMNQSTKQREKGMIILSAQFKLQANILNWVFHYHHSDLFSIL